jgi:ribonuclease H / adenosylcobalamin/alpha-ribazole phosphatase
MVDLLFLRHAETEISESKRWHGRSDPPLSPEGQAHAQRAARWLSELGREVIAILSSDRCRAFETATVLGKALRRPVHTDAKLRERDLGDWTGLSLEEIERGWPGQLDAWRQGRLSGPPGGETDQEVARRLTQALLPYGCSDASALLVVVAHAGLLRGLLATQEMDHGVIQPLGGHWLTLSSEQEAIAIGPKVSI